MSVSGSSGSEPRRQFQDSITTVPSKPKRPKKFSPAKETRRQSREVLGTPKPTRVEQDVRRKPPKHKKRQLDDVLL